MEKIILCIFMIFPLAISAQNVGINEDGSSPNSAALLDIKSNSKGILISRLDTSDVINPVEGLLIFQASNKTFYYYKSGNWSGIINGQLAPQEFSSDGPLIFNAGNIDNQDLSFGRNTLPDVNVISDYFFFYDQSTSAFRGGEVENSDAWAPTKLGENSFAYGKNIEANAKNAVAFGNGNIAGGNNAFTIGLRDPVLGNGGSGVMGAENL